MENGDKISAGRYIFSWVFGNGNFIWREAMLSGRKNTTIIINFDEQIEDTHFTGFSVEELFSRE